MVSNSKAKEQFPTFRYYKRGDKIYSEREFAWFGVMIERK